MTPDEAKKVLVAFNKEADYLFNSKFNLEILSDPELGRMEHKDGETSFLLISDYRSELNDFGMVYRLFIQRKDSISFERMENLYHEKFVPPDLLKQFMDMKQRTDNLFAAKLTASWEGAPDSYARLHEIIMYGELAHKNADKVKLYEEFQKYYAINWIAWTSFAIAIGFNMMRIQFIHHLNDKLLAHLS